MHGSAGPRSACNHIDPCLDRDNFGRPSEPQGSEPYPGQPEADAMPQQDLSEPIVTGLRSRTIRNSPRRAGGRNTHSTVCPTKTTCKHASDVCLQRGARPDVLRGHATAATTLRTHKAVRTMRQGVDRKAPARGGALLERDRRTNGPVSIAILNVSGFALRAPSRNTTAALQPPSINPMLRSHQHGAGTGSPVRSQRSYMQAWAASTSSPY